MRGHGRRLRRRRRRRDRGSDRARKVANWDSFHAEVLKHMPEDAVDRYRFDGNPYALWAQVRVEAVMSDKLKRQLAAMAYPVLALPGRLRGVRATRT